MYVLQFREHLCLKTIKPQEDHILLSWTQSHIPEISCYRSLIQRNILLQELNTVIVRKHLVFLIKLWADFTNPSQASKWNAMKVPSLSIVQGVADTQIELVVFQFHSRCLWVSLVSHHILQTSKSRYRLHTSPLVDFNWMVSFLQGNFKYKYLLNYIVNEVKHPF